MRRILLLGGLLLVVTVAILVVYVGVPMIADLAAARKALVGLSRERSAQRMATAQVHLARARERLDSPAGRILSLVPVVAQNLEAVDAVSASSLRVLGAGRDLTEATDRLEAGGLLARGAVRMDEIQRLRTPLREAATSLSGLESELGRHRNGWLVPPLWSVLDDLLHRVGEFRASAEAAAELSDVAARMLGEDGRRTYLVLMMNNSELRGAGGILSGVGTIGVDRGRLSLGSFYYYRDLADPPPYREVPAPVDFEEHFGEYDADTTRWVATTSSPDVPDVALVARRLFRLSTGRDTDGAILVDPRGLASLLPEGARIRVPTTETILRPKDFAPYVYSRAYEEVTQQTRRRDALIGVGAAAFETILESGPKGFNLARAGSAVRGGHLRFASFEPREQAALEDAGLGGELGQPEGDAALVTVQNYGGNKLDFYARRTIRHECSVDEALSSCVTEAVIVNRTPLGLTPFQYQYKPYGLFKNFVEIYVPAAAELTRVQSRGQKTDFFLEREDGYEAVGAYLEIPRNEKASFSVSYTLRHGGGDGYSFELSPQPLSEDAAVEVELRLPLRWSSNSDLKRDGGAAVMRFDGELGGPLKFEAGPSDRTGLSALWESFSRFWNEPVL